MVGATGFEPATSWSRTKRSSQTEPRPDLGKKRGQSSPIADKDKKKPFLSVQAAKRAGERCARAFGHEIVHRVVALVGDRVPMDLLFHRGRIIFFAH